jgi:hypothetical protein
LKERNVRLVFANATDHVVRELNLSSVTQMVGADAYFDDLSEVLERFQTDAVREPGDDN